MIEIIYKTKNYIIVYKPPAVPTQSDTTGDIDAMSLASQELRKSGENPALWLVHRLDRVVGGLVVFARSREYAAKLSSLVGDNGMEKEYLAVVDGKCEGGVLRDFIYKDSKKSKAFVVDSARRGAKEAILEYSVISEKETERGIKTLVKVKLHTGRFHQIRVQLASRKTPLVGDGKYGSHDNRAKFPALFAARLAFRVGNDICDINKLPDFNEYPWSLFGGENYL